MPYKRVFFLTHRAQGVGIQRDKQVRDQLFHGFLCVSVCLLVSSMSIFCVSFSIPHIVNTLFQQASGKYQQ